MKKTLFTILLLLPVAAVVSNAYTLKRVSVHDPSVVYDPSTKYYYIFGSHRAAARTNNMMMWNDVNYLFGLANDEGTITTRLSSVKSGSAANTYSRFFKTNMTKSVTIGGEEKTFGNFDVWAWSNAGGSNYDVDGMMWAPDVIYNERMQKWCMYMSINGDNWASSIVLLTADKITGPYVYQGPVVFSGFGVNSNAGVSYKKTDLELVIGTVSSLPSRYTAYWGRRWPNCIDPCVFYDEEGRLWMSYGSWSGGIWMLELNEETGLRDYDVKYNSTGGSTDGVTSDPYYGKKIAGGFYSSGEGSYIEYIGGYYYLFVSNGGLTAGGVADDYNAGGYQMRVFRSKNPNGPFVDSAGRTAVLTAYELNFGPGLNNTASSNRGVNIFGAYGSWGLMSDGERSQGHNSIIAAEDGRTYLIYHTRFQNGGEGHAVRVHQVFQNEDGWLVAAPFEYTGEEVKSDDISTTQQVAVNQIPGVYQLLVHNYRLDHRKKELSIPVEVTLHADGTISGSYSGKWAVVDGASYITLTIGTTQYKGVMVDQVMESNTTQWPSTTFAGNAKNQTVAFTALAKNGVTVWGYRSGDDPTGIRESVATMSQQTGNGALFDLQGRRVTKPTGKRIYIENGRKRVIK